MEGKEFMGSLCSQVLGSQIVNYLLFVRVTLIQACIYTTSYPGSPCLKVLVTRRGPWQTLTAWLPNNPKILDYFVTWPFLAMIHRGEQRRKKNKITINKILTNTTIR